MQKHAFARVRPEKERAPESAPERERKRESCRHLKKAFWHISLLRTEPLSNRPSPPSTPLQDTV